MMARRPKTKKLSKQEFIELMMAAQQEEARESIRGKYECEYMREDEHCASPDECGYEAEYGEGFMCTAFDDGWGGDAHEIFG